MDYSERAQQYRRNRSLSPYALDQWRLAVITLIPGVHAERILDVGSGTGQFSAPLADWLGGTVVAIEPSAAMRNEARRAARHDICLVAGRCEALPAADDSIDCGWLSTVLHQLTDIGGAIRELRRVVRAGGWVLVRGFFADMRAPGLFAHFPGIERCARTFPTSSSALEVFAEEGFTHVDTLDVTECHHIDLTAWERFVTEMRQIDSMLRGLSEAELVDGMETVRRLAAERETLPHDVTFRLLAFS